MAIRRHIEARHTHDCDKCRYLGPFDRWDLWVCESDRMRGQRLFDSTLIARASSEGSDYASFDGLTVLRSFLGKPAEARSEHSQALCEAWLRFERWDQIDRERQKEPCIFCGEIAGYDDDNGKNWPRCKRCGAT